MADRRLSLAAASAFLCAALGLWVSLGAITLTGAHTQRARFGILPPLSWLAALLGVAFLCLLIARPQPRRVAVLWLSALVLLPWLPGRMPLSVFIWAGPARFWLWIAIAATLLVSSARRLSSARLRHALTAPRQAVACATGLAAVVFAIGAWAVFPRLPTGDEPHYLIITQSLVQDHDLQIENNHRQGDYRAYFTPELKPHSVVRGVNGQVYSIHAPGLPILIAPAFAAFGYRGVIAMLVAMAAIATGLAWFVAWRVTGLAAASWFGWATVTLSAPFFFHSFAVYPDGVGAAIVLIGVLPLVDGRAREWRSLLLIGAALALLPWLHTRFAILAAALTIVTVARIATAPGAIRRAAAFFVFPVLSAAAWLAFFAVIYGVPNPAAPYGGVSQLDLGALKNGVTGLIFDHEFGLLPNAPVYVCALAGLAVMLARGQRRLGVELLTVAVPYFLAVAMFPMWWGGFSAPARFLVPVTLVLAIPSAAWFATRQTETARLLGLGAVLLSASIVAAIAFTDRGAPLFNVRDGSSILLQTISPVVNLTTAVPSVFQHPPSRVILDAAVWSLGIVAALLAGRAFERRGWSGQSLATIAGAALAGWTMVTPALLWRTSQAPVVTPETGGLALLQQYRPDRQQLGVAYAPFRRIPATDVPPRMTLADRLDAVALSNVPAGIYEMEASGALVARVRIGHDRYMQPIDEWDAAGTRRLRPLVLPVGIAALRIHVDGPPGGTAATVSLRGRRIFGVRDAWPDVVAWQGARYGPAVLFHINGRVDFEPGGVWVRGMQPAEFIVVPDAESPIRVFVRSAPIENRVVLESGSWREELNLGPSEERIVSMPADATRMGTALRVTSRRSISPAAIDPQSEDRRVLGCFIATR
jgi:hypothetical protein